ncbi:MAG TPA: hypothetical protein VMY59_06810 [Candidatus Thermoplasmatota archaeon]|nr:hypothetical protein [Candidatus Thermoplasmatota archaeon]
MRKIILPFLTVFIILILCIVIIPLHARAGQAGVGVINVPPKYGYIRVEEQDNFIRVYLNISDYNSWADINNVSVTLDNYGAKLSTFLFQQYKSLDSYVEINEFSETPETMHLLDVEKCFFEKSNQKETIDERCDIAVRFVFQKTFFTGLSIVINDRAGFAPAEAYIYYNSEESMRSGNSIVIPWIGLRITIDIPPYLIDAIAIAFASIGLIYYLKKTGIREQRREQHEKTS